jgi:hypothetical protein
MFSCRDLHIAGHGHPVGGEKSGCFASLCKRKSASLFEDADVKKQDDGCRAWYWDGFKWYSSDSGVAFLEGYLDDLEWDQYLYIRVGEELDDVDYRGGLWDNPFGMCLTRAIEFNED